MTPAIDAVIVSYNSRDTLRACVEPLSRMNDLRVTVVDNESQDGSLAEIADLPVRAIPSGRNGGFGFGCNIGVAAGNAPFVLFVNPDARIDHDDLVRMLAVLDAEPDVGIVGPRIVDTDGTLFASMRRFQRVGSVWATALFLHRIFTRAAWANEIIYAPESYERVAYPEWVSGACMLVRRSAIEAIRGFDERYFLYAEDMDLCARARAAGYRVRYEPNSTVLHEGGRSAPRTSLYAVLAHSRMQFARLHSRPTQTMLQYLGLAVGALTHAIATAPHAERRRGHAAAFRAIVSPSRRGVSRGRPVSLYLEQ